MTRDKYGVHDDPYCYAGTSVLRNILDIKDQKTLEDAEAHFSATAIREIEFQPPPYTMELWRIIHRKLFCAVYDWAGNFRTVDISKESTRFCNNNFISAEGDKLFIKLQEENWLLDADYDNFIRRIAYYFCEINVLHPFREGNGRSQRIIFEFICMNCGYSIDWSKTSPAEWIDANIAGFNGTYGPMENIFRRITSKIAPSFI